MTAVGEAFLPAARRVVAASAHARDVGRRAAQGRPGDPGRLRRGPGDGAVRVRRTARGPSPDDDARAARGRARPAARRRLVLGAAGARGTRLGGRRAGAGPGRARRRRPGRRRADRPGRALRSPARRGAAGDEPRGCTTASSSGCAPRGADVVVAHDAERLDRLVPLVLSGVAIGITQGRAVGAGLPPGVVARPLAGDDLLVEHRLVWRRDAGRPRLSPPGSTLPPR